LVELTTQNQCPGLTGLDQTRVRRRQGQLETVAVHGLDTGNLRPGWQEATTLAESVPGNGVTLFFGLGLAAVTGRRLLPGQ
jgi:hypothetical protein